MRAAKSTVSSRQGLLPPGEPPPPEAPSPPPPPPLFPPPPWPPPPPAAQQCLSIFTALQAGRCCQQAGLLQARPKDLIAAAHLRCLSRRTAHRHAVCENDPTAALRLSTHDK